MEAILEITDGTTKISLLDAHKGFHLIDWQPSFPQAKDGGVFRSSPFAPGRALVNRQFDNLFETFTVSVDADSQDTLIAHWTELIDLLEGALDYWLSSANFTPVYFKARASCETNERYAVVKNYSIPSLSNPYFPPFFSADGRFSTPEIPITIELGLWTAYAPGSSVCLPMSNTGVSTVYTDNAILNPGFETAGGGGADVFANWTESAGDGAIARDLAVFHSGVAGAKLTSGPNSNTHIYQDFTVAPGETLILSFFTRGDGTNAGRWRVNALTTGVDLRSLTSTAVTGTSWTLVTGKWIVPATVVTVRLYLYCPAVNAGIGYFDDTCARRSDEEVTFGHAKTCNADALHIGNSSSRAQLTDAFYFDASGGTFSSQLLNAALPTQLLPTIPAAGDYLAIGIDASSVYPGPFSSVIFDIATAISLVQISATWEYWTGSTWTTIPAGTRLDDTANLSITGIRGLYFDMPADMNPGTVNSVNAFWIRYRVTSVGASPTPPSQGNRPMYTAIYPYVDVLASDVPGSMPAILEMFLEKKSKDITATPVTSVIFASRVVDRGDDFNMHIYASDRNQPVDATLTALISITLGTNVSFLSPDGPAIVNQPAYPTGRLLQYQPGAATAAMATRAKWGIATPLASDYHGKFRVFLYHQSYYGSTLSNEYTLRLYYNNNLRYTADVSIGADATGGPIATELGIIDLFSDVNYGSELIDLSYLDLHASHNSANNSTLFICGLVIIPADEILFQATYQADILAGEQRLDMDGGKVPKRGNFAGLYTSGGLLTDVWSLVSPGGIIVNQKEDVRIWCFHIAPHEIVSSPNGFINPRYHIMRGAQ